MKKSRTFLNRNLQEILLEILPSETPGDFYQSANMAPTFRTRLPYSAQYNETTFEYLKRLATRYGQWFYWDGMRLQFGAIKDSKVKLISGSSVHDFTTATHFAPQKASLAAYDYEKGAKIQATQRKVSGGSSDGLAAHMAQKQHDYFTRDMVEVSAYTAQAAGQQDLDEMAKLQAAAAAAYNATYSGVSYEPLGVGRAFMVMEGPVEYRLVAVSVQHLSDNHGNYRCTFTAIPADVAAPPYTDPHCFAHAESQPAMVYDNNDPEGMGRIKVLFYWGQGYNVTDWVRMVQPHSGAGKGFYFIPEKGEEVLVGFEGGNAEKPYVIGTQYNGKQSSGYSTPDNDQKVIHTRSGCKMIFNDAEKSILIEDPSGNTWLMDGQGNISVHAPKNFTVNAGENISMTAGKDISISAGKNISNTANDNISHIAGQDIQIAASGDIKEDSDKRMESATKDIRRQSDNMDTLANNGISIFSEKENMTLQSKQTVEHNSGEKSNMF
jgi:uncharacterized protein involved in type VI secretion and phage assembly